MKRILSSVLVLAVLVIALAVPAFATYDIQTFTYEFVDPYSIPVSDENGNAIFGFIPYYMGIPTAFTDMAVPTGGYGRVYAYIAFHCISARSKDSTTINNGIMSCEVYLPLSEFGHVVYNITSKTAHYANLIVDGNRSFWNYTYVSSAHDPNITEPMNVGMIEDVAQ